MNSPYLINYKAPMIVFEFEKFPGSFYYQVPESEHPRYSRVLQAYEGDIKEAQERLRITFQTDAERSYNQWLNQNMKKN